MANPVQRRRFVARSATNPDSQADGTKPRHMFRQNCEAIGEAGGLKLIYHRFYLGNWLTYLFNVHPKTWKRTGKTALGPGAKAWHGAGQWLKNLTFKTVIVSLVPA